MSTKKEVKPLKTENKPDAIQPKSFEDKKQKKIQMMTNNKIRSVKYYRPNLNEFHIGFEFEYKTRLNSNFEVKNDDIINS